MVVGFFGLFCFVFFVLFVCFLSNYDGQRKRIFMIPFRMLSPEYFYPNHQRFPRKISVTRRSWAGEGPTGPHPPPAQTPMDKRKLHPSNQRWHLFSNVPFEVLENPICIENGSIFPVPHKYVRFSRLQMKTQQDTVYILKAVTVELSGLT